MRLAASLLLLSALLARSATYYVSTNGSDSANGTTAPWLTIQHAADTMTAGDTCIVSNGLYLERVTTGASGTPSGRITFEAESTNAAVNSWTITKSNITVRGFTVLGKDYGIEGSVWVKAGGHNAQIVSNVFLSSAVGTTQLYIDGTIDRTLSGTYAEGNLFLDGGGHSVVVSGGNNTFTNNFFTSTNGNDAFRIVGTNTLIVANRITNWSNIQLTGGDVKTNALYYFVALGDGMNWTNTGARKYYKTGIANKWTATGTTPTSWGTYTDAHGQAVVARADNAYLYPSNGSLTIGTNYYFESIYAPWDRFTNVQAVPTVATGISNQWTAIGTTPSVWCYAVVGYGTNIVLTNGTLEVGKEYFFVEAGSDPDFNNVGAADVHEYQTGEGYYFKATNSPPVAWGSGTVVESANHPDIIQAFQNGAVGTIPPDYPSWDLIFERNHVSDCNGVQLGNITDDNNHRNLRGWTFRNNIVVRVSNALNLFAPEFNFHNNTFYQCALNSGWVIGWGATGSGTASNITVFNNLLVECGDPTRDNSGWYGGDAAMNQLSDYNLVVGTGAGTTKVGFSEPHSLNGIAPLFVDAANGDFRLLTNSPAIGAGTNLTALGVTVDFTGSTRTNWTIGAMEGTGEAPPTGPDTTPTPTFSPAGGNFTNSVTVTISCATSGASIRYSIGGTATTNSSVYTSPLVLSSTTTLSAIAFKAGEVASSVTNATYTKVVVSLPNTNINSSVKTVIQGGIKAY